MKKTITLIFLLISSFSFAKELKVGKEEFLRKVDKGLVNFTREPMIPTADIFQKSPELGQKALDMLMNRYQTMYPITFHRDFFYVAIVRTKNYHYQIAYDWSNGGCYYSFKSRALEDKIIEMKNKLLQNNSNMNALSKKEQDFLKNKPKDTDLETHKIDLKYCEKVYNRKIKKYSPKQREVNRENFQYNKK